MKLLPPTETSTTTTATKLKTTAAAAKSVAKAVAKAVVKAAAAVMKATEIVKTVATAGGGGSMGSKMGLFDLISIVRFLARIFILSSQFV